MRVVILSIYLPIYLFVRTSLSLLKSHPIPPSHPRTQQNPTAPHPTPPQPALPYQQHPPLSLPYTASIPIEIGPKRPRAEMTHLLRPKRPTLKIGRNDPGRNHTGPKRPGFDLHTPVFKVKFWLIVIINCSYI